MGTDFRGIRIGVAVCASFCTFGQAVGVIRELKTKGAEIIPIMSENAAKNDTRFGSAAQFINEIEGISERKVIKTLQEAEKVGPQNMADLILIMPCTGNTLAKLANGITDTSVLMATKGHMRNNKPVCIAISTNDALGLNLENIGKLLNTKNIYFVPFRQDNSAAKPKSMAARFDLAVPAIEGAFAGEQIQPIILGE